MNVKKSCILGIILFLITFLLIGCNKDENVNIQTTKANIKPYAHPEYLISAEQLKTKLGQPNLTVIDTRSPSSYVQGHIPGAICFNIKHTMDPNRKGRFTSSKMISLYMRKIGVNSSDRIVVYSDDASHARLWCILNIYGLKNIQILNGGFEQWEAKGYETAIGRERKIEYGKFKISQSQVNKENIIIGTAEVADAAEAPANSVIIDARSVEEYSSGHIPGAVNIPWDQLINEDTSFKNTSELKGIFTSKKITPNKQVIVYSRNATRASFVYYTLNKLLGYDNVRIYDGYRIYWAPHKTRETGTE